MANTDLEDLRGVLHAGVRASGRGVRELETELELRHGGLRRLIFGDLDIRVSHLLGLARVLRVPPSDFLDLGCAVANRTASLRLIDWLGPLAKVQRARPRPAGLPASAAELAALIQSEVAKALAERDAAGAATAG
ncbi:MAG TPA: hypothetical protein VIH93_09520 [Thermoanaerobaculia bacterium]|jgi:hypothetical protein